MQNYCNSCCRIHTRRCSSGGHFSIILTAVNAHNALARNAKTQTRPFCAVVTDCLAFEEVKRVKCLLRTVVPLFQKFKLPFFRCYGVWLAVRRPCGLAAAVGAPGAWFWQIKLLFGKSAQYDRFSKPQVIASCWHRPMCDANILLVQHPLTMPN